MHLCSVLGLSHAWAFDRAEVVRGWVTERIDRYACSRCRSTVFVEWAFACNRLVWRRVVR